MRKAYDILFTIVIVLMTSAAAAALAFVIFFIVKEALPIFNEVSLKDFLFGNVWMPIDFFGETSFGIFNFIMGTIYVSFVAMIIAGIVGLGAAMYLACDATDKSRSYLYPFVDLLAGIPSVVYGFIGLEVIVKFFLKAGVHTGSCVLAAGILLAIMILPYLISSCSESMLKSKRKYMSAANALGVDNWYAMATVVFPASLKSILMSLILAIGRAMGETMAVMMVMGNANLFPKLLNKGETIASVIALEMGTAVNGSPHYHALYAAGLVLMVLLFVINVGISLLRKYLMSKES